MVGIDIVKIERFKGVKPSFVERVFTEREQEYLQGRKEQSMAGIFAAKEAVAKAFGTGFVGFSLRDIEILHDSVGKPYVVLHGAARGRMRENHRRRKLRNRREVEISITHSDTDAVAVAVVLG